MIRAALLVALLALATRPITAHGQLGEFHVGVMAGYGTPESYRAGGGVSIAVVPGRITFLGLRYVVHGGSTRDTVVLGLPYNVRTSSATIAADLGIQFPVRGAEIVVGASLGSTRFHQQDREWDTNPDSVSIVAWEFFGAPSITAYFRLGRFLIAPELQWGLAGDPDFKPHFSHRGPLFYLRFVLPFEIDRIRQ